MTLNQYISAQDRAVNYATTEIIMGGIGTEMAEQDKVVSGRSRESMHVTTTSTPFAVLGEVYSSNNLVIFAKDGRGPGKPTPIAPLIEWAMLRGFDKKEAKSLAFAISKKHAKRGSNPRYKKPTLIQDAEKKFLPQVGEYLNKEIGTITNQYVFNHLRKVWKN